MSMTNDIKKVFGKMTPIQLAAEELAEAELALLRSETSVEYAAALVSYNKQRIKRLKAYLVTQNKARTE